MQPPIYQAFGESKASETHGESFLQPMWNRAPSWLALLPKMRRTNAVPGSLSIGFTDLRHQTRVEGRKKGGAETRSPHRLRRAGCSHHIRGAGLGCLLPRAALVHVLGPPLGPVGRVDRLRVDAEGSQLLEASAAYCRQWLRREFLSSPFLFFQLVLAHAASERDHRGGAASTEGSIETSTSTAC